MPVIAALALLFKQEEISLAYHGTTIEIANVIVETQQFLIPEEPRNSHIFGPAVYFWENSYDMALRWGERNFSDQIVGIVKARLELQKILDLRDGSGVTAFNDLSSMLMDVNGAESVGTAQVLAFAADLNLIDSCKTSTQPNLQKRWKPVYVIVCVYNTQLIKAPCLA